MMRAAHSIKGAARIVGVEPAVRVAHVMEDCFTAAKAGSIALTSAAVDVLLHAVDVLQKLCAAPAEQTPAAEPLEPLLERLAALRDGRGPAPAEVLPADPPAEAPPALPPVEEPPAAVDAAPEIRVALPAVLDATGVEALRKELAAALGQAPARIMLEFSAVRQISAGGLALLASFAREAARAAPRPSVQAGRVSPAMAALLRVTRLDGPFGV
jgi:two-component system sensor histidine kinase and response regulator WspE